MGKHLDLTGQKYGRLTCVKEAGRNKCGQVLWECRCDCGNRTLATTNDLRTGNTKSCGCIKREIIIKRNVTHALSKGRDGKKTRLYNKWVRMKQRCFDKSSSDYDRYGGRGITVCSDWLKYKSFYDWAVTSDYQDGLTIERKNVNGNYEPSNCKWITMEEQARNKRNNHFITFGKSRKTLAEWGEITGIESSTIRQRLNLGWTPEKALTTKVRRRANG
jgi:hypothetical protein